MTAPNYQKGPSNADRGEAVLREMNLSASTDPRRFTVSRPGQLPALARASLPALLRGGCGAFALDYRARLVPRDDQSYSSFSGTNWQIQESSGRYVKAPAAPLVLYDDLSDPSCQLVREACSVLSLPVTMKPCSSSGKSVRRQQRFRTELRSKYGSSASVPFLVDPNTSATFDSVDDAISYLFQVYGGDAKEIPPPLRPGWGRTSSAALGTGLARWGSGPNLPRGFASNPSSDSQLVTLWAYEGSPFCRVVREALEVFEVPHTVLHCPRGSDNRIKLFKEAGFFQVPCLDDPSTGVRLWESEAIIEYLTKRYGVMPSPVNYL